MIKVGLGDNFIQMELDESGLNDNNILGNEITDCRFYGPGNGSYIKKSIDGVISISLKGYHLAPIEHYVVLKKEEYERLINSSPTAPEEQ